MGKHPHKVRVAYTLHVHPDVLRAWWNMNAGASAGSFSVRKALRALNLFAEAEGRVVVEWQLKEAERAC